MTNALHSLYGGAAARSALAGTVGGQAREQEAWTPDWVLDAVRGAFGGRIGLDPCGASEWELPPIRKPDGKIVREAISGGWFADLTLRLGGEDKRGPHGGLVLTVQDALKEDWTALGESIFQNPAYDALQPWLAKCVESAQGGAPVVHLGPVRPRRSWWWPLAATGEIVWLNYDVRFRGYKQAHPENLCLISWNCTIPNLGKRENWRTPCESRR